MKEMIFYSPECDEIILALKDDRTLENGKWKQRWWIYNGHTSVRPSTNEAAAKLLKSKDIVILESARFLDEYR